MGNDRRDKAADARRLRLLTERELRRPDDHDEAGKVDLVFDFTDVHHPGFADLSLILTARLQARPEDRVWVRAVPYHTWQILKGLGLDHLFRHYPGPDAEPN
jgi:hypothetical protein